MSERSYWHQIEAVASAEIDVIEKVHAVVETARSDAQRGVRELDEQPYPSLDRLCHPGPSMGSNGPVMAKLYLRVYLAELAAEVRRRQEATRHEARRWDRAATVRAKSIEKSPSAGPSTCPKQEPSPLDMPKTKTTRRTRALVGWTGSNADSDRGFAMLHWMTQNRMDEVKSDKRKFVDTKFDMAYQGDPCPEYGGDFLLDDRTFETVVLEHIFVGWDDTEMGRKPNDPIADHFSFTNSPKHSEEAWRERLVATEAKRIFVFGGEHEVSWLFLGDIPGYAMIRTEFGAVYERDELSLEGYVEAGTMTERQARNIKHAISNPKARISIT